MLQGSEIFNLFFEGTKYDDLDDRGNVVTKFLHQEWFKIDQYFTNALNDITETTNDRVKSMLENWFEVLKKVMRMWSSGTMLDEKARNNYSTKHGGRGMQEAAASKAT